MLITRLLFFILYFIQSYSYCCDSIQEYASQSTSSPRKIFHSSRPRSAPLTPRSCHTSELSADGIESISISPRFKIVASNEKILTDYTGNGHSFYFSCFGLLDRETEPDRDNALLLSISTNNNFKIKSFRGHIDKQTLCTLNKANKLEILKNFIVHFKLPPVYQTVIQYLPGLQRLLSQYVYHPYAGYLRELKILFDDLNLEPSTKCVYQTDRKKASSIGLLRANSMVMKRQQHNHFLPVSKSLLSKTDPELMYNSLKPPTTVQVQQLFKFAQENRQKCELFLDEIKELLPDILSSHSLNPILDINEENKAFEADIYRQYLWIKILENVEDEDKFTKKVSRAFGVASSVMKSSYYKETVNRLRLESLLVIKSDCTIEHDSDSSSPYHSSIKNIKKLLFTIEKQFSNLDMKPSHREISSSSCGPLVQVGAIYQNPQIKTGTAPEGLLSAPGIVNITRETASI